MFVGRRPDGSIYGMWTCRQPDDADHLNMEELPDEHPEVVAFLNRPMMKPTVTISTLAERVSELELKTGA